MKSSYKVGLALIFCYLVAWLDRMAINMTIPFIAQDLDIKADKIGFILSAFFAGYALFQIPGGILADKFGARRVILAALSWWSLFTAFTGMVGSFSSMIITRFFFGVGEGVFPASVWKILGSWFTKKNRATANALVISSIALGPALTPLILAPILAHYSWRTCFLVLGLLGIVCVLLAYKFIFNNIQQAPFVNRAEIDEFIQDEKSDEANSEKSIETISLRQLLKEPLLWVIFSIGLIFNITMYGWLNWLPSYLLKVKGLDLKQMAFAASIPFMFAAIGCMSSGYISDRWFRGRRKLLVLICMIIGGLALFSFTRIDDLYTYMFMQCVAGFTLFMASGAIWAIPMIYLPPRLMGSGSGFINTGGQIGGFLTNIIIGQYISFRGENYAAGFDVMLGALVLATLIVFIGIREKAKN